MEILYVTISCALLTWLKWNQHIQGRSYPFVGISCLYWMWMLANGTTIPLDSVTIATIALLLWMLGSFIWSQSAQCVLEFFVWASYLTVFTAARMIPLEWMMWILVPNSIIMAVGQIYNMTVKKLKDDYAYSYPIFGNSNHNAAFMVVGFFAALWLAVNVSIYMLIVAAPIGYAIMQTRRRGPILAMVASLILLAIMTRSENIIYLCLVIVGLAIHYRRRFHEQLKNLPFESRMEIYRDAVSRIKRRYLMGRGLNCYRGTSYGRVHNDSLELIGEIGIIGYALFLNIFFQIHYDPIILCGVVAYFIVSMFFYPFREVHTATPFWAMLGAMAGFSYVQPSTMVLQAVGMGVVFGIMLFVFTVFGNLAKFDADRYKKEAPKEHFSKRVVEWQTQQQS